MAAQFSLTKVPCRRGAEIVDGARHQFLAGAGFAGDQHGGVGGRDGLHLLQNGLQCAALADDLFEALSVRISSSR